MLLLQCSVDGCQFTIFPKVRVALTERVQSFVDMFRTAIFGSLDFLLDQIAYLVVKLLMLGLMRFMSALAYSL